MSPHHFTSANVAHMQIPPVVYPRFSTMCRTQWYVRTQRIFRMVLTHPRPTSARRHRFRQRDGTRRHHCLARPRPCAFHFRSSALRTPYLDTRRHPVGHAAHCWPRGADRCSCARCTGGRHHSRGRQYFDYHPRCRRRRARRSRDMDDLTYLRRPLAANLQCRIPSIF